MYSLHCEHQTKQPDTLFSYKLDFIHSKGPRVMGHHRIFRPKKKDVTNTPIEKKISKKGLLLILWILMKKEIWFWILKIVEVSFKRLCGPTGWVHVLPMCWESRIALKLDLNWKFFTKLEYHWELRRWTSLFLSLGNFVIIIIQKPFVWQLVN